MWRNTPFPESGLRVDNEKNPGEGRPSMDKRRIIAGIGLAVAVVVIGIVLWQVLRPDFPDSPLKRNSDHGQG